tara:strand:+ start:1095 stop:5969 length:4875 start_codon:yes stop_codon:yes gene_type:complete
MAELNTIEEEQEPDIIESDVSVPKSDVEVSEPDASASQLEPTNVKPKITIVKPKLTIIPSDPEAPVPFSTPENPSEPEINKGSDSVILGITNKKNYNEVLFEADLKEMDRRKRATAAILFGSKSKVPDARKVLEAIANSPLTLRTKGEAVVDIATKNLSREARKVLAGDLDIARGDQVVKDSVAKNLGFPRGNFEKGMSSPNDAVKGIANHYKNIKGSDEVETPNQFLEWLEYANPIGSKQEDKGMEIPLWQMTKDIITFDFDYDDFNTRMTSNYGNEWDLRFLSFLGKEVGLDAIILGATFAIPPLAGVAALGLAARRAGFVGAAIRTAAVGVGGGALQAGQNVALDRDANFVNEAIGRAAGQGIGEVAVPLLGKGIRYIRGNTLKDHIAQESIEAGTKPITEQQLKEALSPVAKLSAHSSITRAQLEGTVNKYNASVSEIADSLTSKELDPEIKLGLAAHLGIDESRLSNIRTDMVLPIFKNYNEELIQQSLKVELFNRQGEEFTDLNGIVGRYFNDGLVAGLRATDDNINKSTMPLFNNVFKWLGVAESEKLGFQSAANLQTVKQFTDRQVAGFEEMENLVNKGLSKKDKQLLGSILKEGDANEIIYNFSSISPKLKTINDVPLKVQTAYKQSRYIQDLAYELADANAVNTLKDKVFKYNGKLVEVQKSAKDLTNFKKGEKVNIREFSTKEMSAVGPVIKDKVLASSLKAPDAQIDTIVPYRVGHVPRMYRDQRFTAIVIDANGKKVSREATFDSNVEIDEWLIQRNAAIAKNPKSTEVAIKVWNKTDTGAGGVHMNRTSAKLLTQVDDESAEIIRKGLLNAGIKEDSVSVILQNMVDAPISSGFTKGRTVGVATTPDSRNKRLELAKNPLDKKIKNEYDQLISDETPYTKQVALNYYSSIARTAGYDNWRKFAFDDFATRYSDVVKNIDPLMYDARIGKFETNFLEKPKTFTNKEWRIKTSEAKDYAKWIQQSVKNRDFFEEAYDHVVTSFSNKLSQLAIEGSTSARAASRVLDSVPLVKELENYLRFVAAVPKLLSFNIAQVIVQGSQATLSAGAAFGFNPVLATRSMMKLGQITGLEAARRLKIRPPTKMGGVDSARTVHVEMLESGYLADLQSTDIIFGLKHGADPHPARKYFQTFGKAAALPFKFGEAVNRTTAYVTVRDQISYAIKRVQKAIENKTLDKQGNSALDNLTKDSPELLMLAKDFDGKLMTEGDIGSFAFREAVVDKAKVLALNMGKAGELRAMSGAGSVALQFKQVLAKELSVMDSSKLTLREKLMGASFMIGAFGAGAIPLAGDMLKLLDYAQASDDDPINRRRFQNEAEAFTRMLGDSAESFSDGFISTEGVQRFFAKGAITAATDGEIDFANRVALGSFMSETFDVQGPEDLIVSIAVLSDLVEAADTLGLGTGALNPLSYIEVFNRAKDGEDFREILLDKLDPESMSAQILDNDVTAAGVALTGLRAGGKLFSQFGSLSRDLDAANTDIVAPEQYRRNPYATPKFATSSLRGLPVERTRLRSVQFWLGITPGKVVEQYSKQKTESIYADAIKDFNYDLQKRFRASFGSREAQRRIAQDAIEKIVDLKKHLEESGIDGPLPRNALNSVYAKLNSLILQKQTGAN